jgi:hypothetical protein
VSDPFRLLLGRADDRVALYANDEVARWAPGVFEAFVSAGLLRAAANAAAVVCDACAGDHVEEVVFVQSPPGTPLRAYVWCPEAGRVTVPLERLRCWEVDLRCLARLLAEALDTAGGTEEVVTSRVWLLGKATLGGRACDIFFCRGLTWADGGDVVGRAAQLQASVRPVVLVPGDPPDCGIWAGDVPSVLPLTAVASWDGARLLVDRAPMEQAVARGKKSAPPALSAFPTPRGAAWEAVRIVVGEHHLRVEVLGKRKQFTFREAGFEERRRGNTPDRLWQLLRLLALHGGVLPLHNPKYRGQRGGSLKQDMSQLGRRLSALLLIDGPPFKDSRVVKRYETRFRIAAEEGLRFPTPEGLNWDGVSVVEVRPGVIVVRADMGRACGIYTAPDAEAGTPGRWEAAVQATTLEREYDLRSLGLADEDGRPTPAGDALIAVLRGDGKVERNGRDKPMLALGDLLTKLMQIDNSPFQFSQSQQKWSALFEASSKVPDASR